MLFENQQVNISKIQNVVRHVSKGVTLHRYPAVLPTYELLYFAYGRVTVNFHGQTIHINEGDILYLPKGLTDGEYSMLVEEEFNLYNVYFQTDSPMPNRAIKVKSDGSILKGVYERIYRIWKAKHDGYYFKAMQQMYHIMELISQLENRYLPDRALKRLILSDAYMHENYCSAHFDYEEHRRLSGLSYSYFKKLFISKYGVPPVKYITKLRIDRAGELLETGKFSVSEVAELCGFETVYYFSKVFKQRMGVSPREYMRMRE